MQRVAVSDADALARAARVLDEGDACVVPLDDQYALAADALDEDAVVRVLDVTRRGADEGLAVCVSGLEDLGHVALATGVARELAMRFWPGPLTLVLRAKAWLPEGLTGGRETVAVRCPGVVFTRDLARRFGPIVATGARRRGQPRASSVDEAARALGADARLYVDAGARAGAASTIVDATGAEAKVLREGALAAAVIAPDGPRGD